MLLYKLWPFQSQLLDHSMAFFKYANIWKLFTTHLICQFLAVSNRTLWSNLHRFVKWVHCNFYVIIYRLCRNMYTAMYRSMCQLLESDSTINTSSCQSDICNAIEFKVSGWFVSCVLVWLRDMLFKSTDLYIKQIKCYSVWRFLFT